MLLNPNLKNSGDVQKLGVVHSHATQRDARKTDFQYDLDPATALILAARIVDCNHYAINWRFANLFIDVTQFEIRATLLSMSFALMSGVPDMFVIQLESASKWQRYGIGCAHFLCDGVTTSSTPSVLEPVVQRELQRLSQVSWPQLSKSALF